MYSSNFFCSGILEPSSKFPLLVEKEDTALLTLPHIPIVLLSVNQYFYRTPYLATDNNLLPVAGHTNRVIIFCKDGYSFTRILMGGFYSCYLQIFIIIIVGNFKL